MHHRLLTLGYNHGVSRPVEIKCAAGVCMPEACLQRSPMRKDRLCLQATMPISRCSSSRPCTRSLLLRCLSICNASLHAARTFETTLCNNPSAASLNSFAEHSSPAHAPGNNTALSLTIATFPGIPQQKTSTVDALNIQAGKNIELRTATRVPPTQMPPPVWTSNLVSEATLWQTSDARVTAAAQATSDFLSPACWLQCAQLYLCWQFLAHRAGYATSSGAHIALGGLAQTHSSHRQPYQRFGCNRAACFLQMTVPVSRPLASMSYLQASIALQRSWAGTTNQCKCRTRATQAGSECLHQQWVSGTHTLAFGMYGLSRTDQALFAPLRFPLWILRLLPLCS